MGRRLTCWHDAAPTRISPHGYKLSLQRIIVGGSVVLVQVEDPGFTYSGEPQLWPSIGEYPVYDETLYQAMTDDTFRNELFSLALAKIAPGKRVLDIGTGRDLNWAVEGVRAGAEHVIAMEAIPNTYRRAAENLDAWGLKERILLYHGSSTDLTITERAEVCVSETIGSVAGAEGAAAIFLDARRRHLTQDSVAIPHRCVTRAAAVSFDGVMRRADSGFAADSMAFLERIFSINEGPFDVRLRIRDPDLSALTSTSGIVEVLEFNGDLALDQDRAITLDIDRTGAVDGILAWMEMSCMPELPTLSGLDKNNHWGSIYFPLFDTPIPVKRGDRLELRSQILVSDDGVHPDYYFEATLRTGASTYLGDASFKHHGDDFRRSAIHRRLFPPVPGV